MSIIKTFIAIILLVVFPSLMFFRAQSLEVEIRQANAPSFKEEVETVLKKIGAAEEEYPVHLGRSREGGMVLFQAIKIAKDIDSWNFRALDSLRTLNAETDEYEFIHPNGHTIHYQADFPDLAYNGDKIMSYNLWWEGIDSNPQPDWVE